MPKKKIGDFPSFERHNEGGMPAHASGTVSHARGTFLLFAHARGTKWRNFLLHMLADPDFSQNFHKRMGKNVNLNQQK